MTRTINTIHEPRWWSTRFRVISLSPHCRHIDFHTLRMVVAIYMDQADSKPLHSDFGANRLLNPELSTNRWQFGLKWIESFAVNIYMATVIIYIPSPHTHSFHGWSDEMKSRDEINGFRFCVHQTLGIWAMWSSNELHSVYMMTVTTAYHSAFDLRHFVVTFLWCTLSQNAFVNWTESIFALICGVDTGSCSWSFLRLNMVIFHSMSTKINADEAIHFYSLSVPQSLFVSLSVFPHWSLCSEYRSPMTVMKMMMLTIGLTLSTMANAGILYVVIIPNIACHSYDVCQFRRALEYHLHVARWLSCWLSVLLRGLWRLWIGILFYL